MVNTELPDILDQLSNIFSTDTFNFNTHKNVYFKVMERKQDKYYEFLDFISSKWIQFKEKNNNRILKKTYTNFLYKDFHEFFKFYLNTFFGFDANSLHLVMKENISKEVLLLEYKYELTSTELKLYQKASENIKSKYNGVLSFTLYLFMSVNVLGILIRRAIREKILITLDCGIIKKEKRGQYLNFLILVRKDNKEIYLNYFFMTLYYFLKQFRGIPEEYYKKLLDGRERLYNIALVQYPTVKDRLSRLLFYFYKKCRLLENFCPLLDFLNFVCSRVEDSIFSKKTIIRKEFLSNFDYTIEKKNSLIRIFDFLDKKSTLYSTFQANNLPSQKSQFNLFILIMKYFFASGLEAFEVGDLLFLPESFRSHLNGYNKKRNESVIGSNVITEINKFMDVFTILSNMEDINQIFMKIFHNSISELNFQFFRSFLKSFNTKFFGLINEENAILSENPENEPYTFNIIVDHISRMLYVLIDKIFLNSSNPDNSSKNFIDPRGRYIGKNIALRVLELFIFQEFNFSDDLWPEMLISINSKFLKKDLKDIIDIPDKFFYEVEDIINFNTTYNLQSFDSAMLFEQWLIDSIIIPLNDFIQKIRNSVKDLSNKNEIYEQLTNFMLKDINSKNKTLVKDIQFLCERLCQYWVIKK